MFLKRAIRSSIIFPNVHPYLEEQFINVYNYFGLFSHVIRESKVYQRTILKNSKSLSTPWLFIYISLFSADCIRRNKCLDGNPSKETDSENWQRCALQCFNDINGECFNWSFFERKCSLFNEETRTETTKSGCINGAWDCYQ